MAKSRQTKEAHLSFEETLTEEIQLGFELAEIPLGERTIRLVGFAIVCVILVILWRVLGMASQASSVYKPRAELNLTSRAELIAPRGIPCVDKLVDKVSRATICFGEKRSRSSSIFKVRIEPSQIPIFSISVHFPYLKVSARPDLSQSELAKNI